MTEEQPTAGEESEHEGHANAYRVELPTFEGPLDLLLHLIKKHELDILDIPIGFVSKKYVEYIKTMELLSIDIASEYLVMAATLAHIKSRSLLPPDPNAAAEDDLLAEEEDPRAELIRRLLEYQKYKNAAENLSARSVLGRDVFTRGAPNDQTVGPAPLAPVSLFKLVDAFEAVLQRAQRVEDHQIDFERISISERIGQISELLRERGGLRFEQLFETDATRADMIVTFLALLEMTKLRMTKLLQAGPLEPIFVELSLEYDDDDDALQSAGAGSREGFKSEFDDFEDSPDVSEKGEDDVLAAAATVDGDLLVEDEFREGETSDADDWTSLDDPEKLGIPHPAQEASVAPTVEDVGGADSSVATELEAPTENAVRGAEPLADEDDTRPAHSSEVPPVRASADESPAADDE